MNCVNSTETRSAGPTMTQLFNYCYTRRANWNTEFHFASTCADQLTPNRFSGIERYKLEYQISFSIVIAVHVCSSSATKSIVFRKNHLKQTRFTYFENNKTLMHYFRSHFVDNLSVVLHMMLIELTHAE